VGGYVASDSLDRLCVVLVDMMVVCTSYCLALVQLVVGIAHPLQVSRVDSDSFVTPTCGWIVWLIEKPSVNADHIRSQHSTARHSTTQHNTFNHKYSHSNLLYNRCHTCTATLHTTRYILQPSRGTPSREQVQPNLIQSTLRANENLHEKMPQCVK
jgi:hypothetical protein